MGTSPSQTSERDRRTSVHFGGIFFKKCLLPSRNLIQDVCIFNIYVKMSFIVRHNYLWNSFRHSCILSTDLFFSLWVSSRTRTKWESWGFKERKPHVVGKELENINERLINSFINFFFTCFTVSPLLRSFLPDFKK